VVLVDTSVWVSHFHKREPYLEILLNEDDVVCHPYVIGELACGFIRNRKEILSLLHSLPQLEIVDQKECLHFVEHKKLMGRGLGFVDIHLLASCLLSKASLWTFDKALNDATKSLRAEYK